MSWEVLTMRSVTSFFNPALARSDLRRHWPIPFLYTAIWLVALPVQLYLRHIAEGASYGTRTVSEVCQGTYSMGVIMAFVFGGVLAMALYSYLMNGRSVGLIHSLPLKRQTLFFTQLLTGFAMLTAGNLLVVLVSLLVCGEPGPLLVWLAVVTLAEIFFLALGTLCAMLTGWLLAVPVLYVGINFLVMAVMQLIHWLAELFIFGYQEDGFGSFTLWCTPVVQLVRRLTDPQGVVAEYVGYPVVSADVSPLENGGWQALGIYAAAAVAILALACMLCIRRRSELSGDVAAFPWMRPVLRYGVGCIGGLALGMILYSVTFGLARSNDIRAYLPGMLLCVVLMTLVCSFGMSMLLGKSLKIFRRTWKGTVLLAALLVRASSTGREEVVFSPEDREGAGKAAVARANELLAKEAAPELPLGDGVVANLLNKVAAGVSAFAQGTAMLAVSEETRDISGGFILKDGRIEVNCTFDALVRAEREQTAGEVAKLLFPEA